MDDDWDSIMSLMEDDTGESGTGLMSTETESAPANLIQNSELILPSPLPQCLPLSPISFGATAYSPRSPRIHIAPAGQLGDPGPPLQTVPAETIAMRTCNICHMQTQVLSSFFHFVQ